MIILLKLKREGGSKIEMADKKVIHFKPNNKGHHVADVTDSAHIKRLLSIPGYYVYEGSEPEEDTEPTPPAPLTSGDTSEPVTDMVDEDDPDFDGDDDEVESSTNVDSGSGEDVTTETVTTTTPEKVLTPAEKRKATMAAKAAAGTNNKPASTAAKKNPALGKE